MAHKTITVKIDTTDAQRMIDEVVASLDNGKYVYVSEDEWGDVKDRGYNLLQVCGTPTALHTKRMLLVELPE